MEETQKLIVEHRETGKLQDSLTIGSPAKNCEVKVYFDAGNPEEAKKRVDEALKMRGYLMEKVTQ
ncbi:MAG: hypothetical protein AABY15_04820 [Nanoarchaeota archaeon]